MTLSPLGKQEEKHQSPGENIIEGFKQVNDVFGAGVTVADGINSVAPIHGLHGLGKVTGPLDMAFGAYDIYKGLKEGGPDGTMDVIGGATSVLSGGLTLAGSGLAPLAGAFGVGLNVGRWADNAFGISDKISEETSGRKDLMDRYGMHFIGKDQRGAQHLDKVGTSSHEMIHNAIFQNRMVLEGKVWDPAVGNFVPRQPAAAPYAHYAE